MAQNSLFCADVPLSNYSLTHAWQLLIKKYEDDEDDDDLPATQMVHHCSHQSVELMLLSQFSMWSAQAQWL